MTHVRAAAQLPVLLAILCAIGLLYVNVSRAWYCGYDDFSETYRAEFQDSTNPARILTTTHNMPFMYRPATTGLQYLTWTTFHHSAAAFRLRNLAMHLMAVAMLYGFVLLLTDSWSVAAGAALLFGLHPMTNETIAVAIWTNATAYALVFGALFLFLLSLRLSSAGRAWLPALCGAFACAFIAIFTYEPAIVVFAIMAATLWVEQRRTAISRQYFVTALACLIATLAVFFVARHFVVTQAAPVNGISVIARNTAMYTLALLTPVDFVFANAVFGTPLPSDAHISVTFAAIAALALGVAVLAAVAIARRRASRGSFAFIDRRLAAFLGAAATLSLLPLLLFRDHASEHDLYPCAAFYAIVLALLARRLVGSGRRYAVLILCVAATFGVATWIRNERVAACAAVAKNIVTQLPVTRWHTGHWHILLATLPGDQLGKPYGAYNDFGVHALETETSVTPGAADAIALAADNDRIQVDVVDARALARRCTQVDACFWISRYGNVTNASSREAARRRVTPHS